MILKHLIQKRLILESVNKKFAETNRRNMQKIKGIPTVINLHKKYNTFDIQHTYDSSIEKVLLVTNMEPCETVEITLNYNFFNYTDIVRMLFIDQMSSSYETIGNVIHFNLKENLINYKFLIGKLAYDKTGHMVINKTSKIDNIYRFYEFEVIGGEFVDKYIDTELSEIDFNGKTFTLERSLLKCELRLNSSEFVNKEIMQLFVAKYFRPDLTIKINELHTKHIENGCIFHVDLKNVYWCSKLQDERKKLVAEIEKGDIVCDVFCGLGPVVIPLLKKGCVVYCNDLNPSAIRCLKTNIRLNKLRMPFVYKKDAIDFLQDVSSVKIDHFILNLPEYSLDFIQYIKSGKIHAYFFCSGDATEYVKEKLNIENADIRFIRKVSPIKCVYKLTYTKMCYD